MRGRVCGAERGRWSDGRWERWALAPGEGNPAEGWQHTGIAPFPPGFTKHRRLWAVAAVPAGRLPAGTRCARQRGGWGPAAAGGPQGPSPFSGQAGDPPRAVPQPWAPPDRRASPSPSAGSPVLPLCSSHLHQSLVLPRSQPGRLCDSFSTFFSCLYLVNYGFSWLLPALLAGLKELA